MGKGLSPLQKDILAIALENRGEIIANKWTKATEVYYAEVLYLHFGWPFKKSRSRQTNAEILNCIRTKGPGAQYFSKEQIGADKYNADMAALSRSMARLERRGLIVCKTGKYSRWSGASLTEAGISIAMRHLEEY